MINELLPHEIVSPFLILCPALFFFEKVKSQLVNKTNWKDSDELALIVQQYLPACILQAVAQLCT